MYLQFQETKRETCKLLPGKQENIGWISLKLLLPWGKKRKLFSKSQLQDTSQNFIQQIKAKNFIYLVKTIANPQSVWNGLGVELNCSW